MDWLEIITKELIHHYTVEEKSGGHLHIFKPNWRRLSENPLIKFKILRNLETNRLKKAEIKFVDRTSQQA